MQLIGYFALPMAFWFSVTSFVLHFYGGWSRDRRFLESARRAVYATTAMALLAAVAMYYSLLKHDFSIDYVARYSDRNLPLFYLISSFWAGHPGSLFLWGLELSIMVAVLAFVNRKDTERAALPFTIGTASGCLAFFLGLSAFISNPFLQFADGLVVPDGQGMNPLLQDPGMFFHPPMLFTGYASWTIPFSFAVGALIAGELDDRWIRSTRLWAIFAWTVLTVGITLGAWWSYKELGWGGYWAWDPVENASIMPWLVGTAYLHSVFLQERRKMFKIWNFALVALAFLTCIFGTFLTRSDILSSLHTFGKTDATLWFLYAIATVTLVSVGLIAWRWPLLRPENHLKSPLSKEVGFALNNLLLLLMLGVVLVGTMFPVITGLTTGTKISVDVGFFNSVVVPLGLVLLFAMGAGPLLGWQQTSKASLRRNFVWPTLLMLASVPALVVLGAHRPWLSLVTAMLCVFTFVCIVQEFARGTRSAMKVGRGFFQAVGWMFARNQRRYGGYLTHLGVVLVFVGICGSQLHRVERDLTLRAGETAQVGPYTFKRGDIRMRRDENHRLHEADLEVHRNGQRIGVFRPSRSFYDNRPDQSFSEVALYYTLAEDVYVVFGGETEDGAGFFRVILSPMVFWLWAGAILMAVGSILGVLPLSSRGREGPSPAAAAVSARP
jgi:cytochrome c-type biogenesis protein CcmF